jgi:hypothetical protein
MNLLDENVREDQRSLLRTWGLPIQQIGSDVGRKGMKDEDRIGSWKLGATGNVNYREQTGNDRPQERARRGRDLPAGRG